MITCPNCGTLNPPSAVECYNCKVSLSGKSITLSSGKSLAAKDDTLVLPSGTRMALKGVLCIGSDPFRCQIVVKDSSVAPLHAQIEVVTPGNVLLQDLGSVSGTTVNAFPLPPRKPVPLANNTKIGLGKVTLLYLQGVPPSAKVVSVSPPKSGSISTPPSSGSTLASFFNPPQSTCEGYVIGVNMSQQRMPLSPGRVMVIIALVILGLYLLVVLIPIGCLALPVAMLIGGIAMYLGKLILGNDVVQQTSFRVQDPLTKTAIPIILYADRGGSMILAENDKVTVHGIMQRNNTLLAHQVQVNEQNGIGISPPAIIRGKLPTSPQVGLVWLVVALIPLFWILLASLGHG